MLNKHKIQGTPSGMTHPIVNIKPTGERYLPKINPLKLVDVNSNTYRYE